MTEANFTWKYPDDAFDTHLGNLPVRSPRPLTEIFRYKNNDYIEDTVEYIKQVCEFAKSDSYVIPTVTGELKKFFDTATNTPVHLKFHRTMKHILQEDYTPRSYRFSPTYQIHDYDNDASRFYDLTKLYQFYINPPVFFRTPFSVGSYNDRVPTQTDLLQVILHPGNYRLLATLFLPVDTHCCMIARTNDYNLLNGLSIEFDKTKTILSTGTKDLANIFNIGLLDNLYVAWSSITGIQMVETHSQLSEYAKDYEIEWTGRQFVVNDVIIATLKNNIFIPPDPIG